MTSVKLSTKAHTLEALRPELTRARIEPLWILAVKQWRTERDACLQRLQAHFTDSTLIVRSSHSSEDTSDESRAGAFHSVLNVKREDTSSLSEAIDAVLASYQVIGECSDDEVILIQTQTANVLLSGVVFTRELETGAPYFQVSYDDQTGRTDTVTSGQASTTVAIKTTTRKP